MVYTQVIFYYKGSFLFILEWYLVLTHNILEVKF